MTSRADPVAHDIIRPNPTTRVISVSEAPVVASTPVLTTPTVTTGVATTPVVATTPAVSDSFFGGDSNFFYTFSATFREVE